MQDSAQRMTKVVREIEVLKVRKDSHLLIQELILSAVTQLVKHPNIVRLHDVIETEKYIGIVLEYASGE